MICIEYSQEVPCSKYTCTHQKSLATLDGEIVDTEIAVKLEMRDVLKVHDVQS